MLKDRFRLPEGKTSAATISINLEGQYFAKMYYPDEDTPVNEGEVLTVGTLGIRDGLPRMLETLDAYDVKATFFTAAAMADEHPACIRELAARGHEVACMGYYHENLAQLSTEEQERILASAKEKLESVSGQPVKGFRMPAGEMSEETLRIVKHLGFTYSSSLSDDDIPYIRESCGLLEIPIHWTLYDLPYFAFTWEPAIPPGQCRIACADDVLDNWLIELEASRKYSTLFNLQLDPQATGEQGRIFMLETILTEIRKDPGIWLATTGEIASFYE